jgi:hypothetical protein
MSADSSRFLWRCSRVIAWQAAFVGCRALRLCRAVALGGSQRFDDVITFANRLRPELGPDRFRESLFRREPDRRRRDEERPLPAANKELAINRKTPLVRGKAPYKFESCFLQQRVSCELGPGSSGRPGAGSTDPQSVSVTAAPSRCPRKQGEHACRQLNCCNVLFGGYEPIRWSVSHE